jgi:hypothetical protein
MGGEYIKRRAEPARLFFLRSLPGPRASIVGSKLLVRPYLRESPTNSLPKRTDPRHKPSSRY